MEMSRDVWKSSPNVISQLEMEAEKHQLDDEKRKDKVRQLKVRHIIPVVTFCTLQIYLIQRMPHLY